MDLWILNSGRDASSSGDAGKGRELGNGRLFLIPSGYPHSRKLIIDCIGNGNVFDLLLFLFITLASAALEVGTFIPSRSLVCAWY